MKYANLFKYRSIWMGIAIIWVFLFHMGEFIDVPFLKQLKDIGYLGCDIFLFSSGLGIYYSLDKNDNVYEYIRKRITRLMPMFWVVLLGFIPFKFYIGQMTWQAAIGNVFGIQFFIDYTYDFNWYIPITLLCYVLAPFLKKHLDSFKSPLGKIITLFVIIGVTYAFSSQGYMMLGMCRIGAFYLGMIFGQHGIQDKEISVAARVIWILLIPVGMFVTWYSLMNFGFDGWNWATNWLPFIISIPGICITLSLIAMVFEKAAVGDAINKVIGFFGKHSLEIYLAHATVVMIFRDYMIKMVDPAYNTTTNWLIAIGISIVGAFVLYWIDRLIGLPFKKEKVN